jgi:hypothetical protein
MVGNGATDWDFDVSPSFPSIAYNFNLIPKKTYDDYNKLGCKVYFNDFKPRDGSDPAECAKLWDDDVQGSMCNLTGDLNWYDLYRPKYGEGLSVADRTRKSYVNGKEFTYVAGRTFREYTPFLKHMIGEAKEGEKEYTMDMDSSAYFNDEEVKKALHLENFTGPWH